MKAAIYDASGRILQVVEGASVNVEATAHAMDASWLDVSDLDLTTFYYLDSTHRVENGHLVRRSS